MNNWQEIHPDFTPELQKEWEKWNFSSEECQKWVIAGLEITESQFARWLENKHYINTEERKQDGKRLFNSIKKNQLKVEYLTSWGDIHPDFAKIEWGKTCWQKWKENGFVKEEAKEWMEIGFKPQHLSWIEQWKEYNFTLESTKQWKEAGFENYSAWYAEEWKKNNFTSEESKQLIKVGFKTHDCETAKKWREQKFTFPQILAWINIGLKTDEVEFAVYLKQKGYQLDTPKLEEIIFQESWRDIQQDFNYRQRNEWEKEADADHTETKKWIELGFKPNESNRAKEWKEGGLNYLEVKQLIVCGLNNQYSWNNWKKLGFTTQQTKKWLDVGLSQWEYNLANYFQSKNYQPMNIDIESLRKDYEKLQGVKIEVDNKFSVETIEQIKGFDHKNLTTEQSLFVDELMPNEELRKRYKKHGLCQECKQLNTYSFDYGWCQPCNSQHFQQGFDKWTSGNQAVDEVIRRSQLEAVNDEQILEWIPYEQFTNIEYLAEGGFGKIYKAEWFEGSIKSWSIKDNLWKREGERGKKNSNKVISLKKLNNSQNMMADFLQEISYHKRFDGGSGALKHVVRCYGISQDPKTKDYIIVMDYIPGGSTRQYLNNHHSKLNFRDKISQLWTITSGLKNIHEQGLIHRDFHTGNILNHRIWRCYIADLGLCRPANDVSREKVYGVLPYVAPELLCGKQYTQATDIYSFGMVAYEILTGLPPYHEFAHDHILATKICEGLRPNLNNVKAPDELKVLIMRCWETKWLIRPTANELHDTLNGWYWKKDSEFYKKYLKVEMFNNASNNNAFSFSYQNHPQAIYTSRLLDFPTLPQPQNNPSQAWQTTTLLDLQLKGVETEIKLLKESLNNEQISLVEEFIQTRQKMLKNEEDEQAMEQAGELEEKLQANGLSEKDIEKINNHCERLVDLTQQLEKQALQTQIEIPTNK